jgi:hypothetical protein
VRGGAEEKSDKGTKSKASTEILFWCVKRKRRNIENEVNEEKRRKTKKETKKERNKK